MRAAVFKRTYEDYLAQIKKLDLQSLAPVLGAEIKEDSLIIPFFGDSFIISKSGISLFDEYSNDKISGNSDSRVPFEVSVVLLKYILMCPSTEPSPSSEWFSFKDFKDAAPLISYFKTNASGYIESTFSGYLRRLENACTYLKATPSPMFQSSYDLSMMFHALPKLPVILNFNDADEEFPASCSILYQKNTACYLDMECVGITGAYLARKLASAVNAG